MDTTAPPQLQRADGRLAHELRPTALVKDFAPAALASVLIGMGNTRVICSANIEEGVPSWMRSQQVEGGWLSAEYCLLPCSTRPRSRRETTAGRIAGRTQEIQRLIGRCLRTVMNLETIGKRTFWIDCDVLQADGGTRTAAITGAWLALRLAINRLLEQGKMDGDPLREGLAAVSVGVVNGHPVLDLDYHEDSAAETDMNVVVTSSGRYVEIQSAAEKEPFTENQLQELLRLARQGTGTLLQRQQAFLSRHEAPLSTS